MTTFLQFSLIGHVFLGLTSIAFTTAILIGLMHKKPNLKVLKVESIFALFSILAAWILSGFYYVTYYGSSVKPIIKEGELPWIHGVIMESKEHIFLFLPFLIIILTLAIFKMKPKDKRGPLKLLSLCIIVLGLAMALMGMAISGAAIN